MTDDILLPDEPKPKQPEPQPELTDEEWEEIDRRAAALANTVVSPQEPAPQAPKSPRSPASPPTADQAQGFENLLPEGILGAVESLGFETSGHWFSLHCLENRVIDVRLENGTHLIAKFYRPGRWTRQAILEEHEFLFDLAAAEVPAVTPIRIDGETLFEMGEFVYALWPRVGGRSPEELSDEDLEVLGRFLGRLHQVGASKAAANRVRLSASTYALSPAQYLLQRFVPTHLQAEYDRVTGRVADLYDELSAGVPVHRVHGDCHLGNLLRGPEGWFFVDFDDSLTGPATQDIWLLVASQDAEGQRQRRKLVEAYQQIRDFDPRWLRLVEPLRALRFIHYSAWVGRRIHEPAFRSAFPDFGSESYWRREISDLENRIRQIELDA